MYYLFAFFLLSIIVRQKGQLIELFYYVNDIMNCDEAFVVSLLCQLSWQSARLLILRPSVRSRHREFCFFIVSLRHHHVVALCNCHTDSMYLFFINNPFCVEQIEDTGQLIVVSLFEWLKADVWWQSSTRGVMVFTP